MKKIIFLILSVIVVLSVGCQCFALETNPDTSDWFVWDMPDERQALGTAIDASGRLDAPAGKYGFTRSKGEYIEFVDTNGATKEARFWGTNISTAALFNDYDKLEELAMRIARSGYNLVRFHAPDLNTDGNNIFGMKNGADTTRELDPDQLDKMFYFFAELKERGVYVYLDLMAYRSVLPGDGLTSESGGMTANANFDPERIALQKEYAEQLLGTVNPYTGMALKDDPALAFLQINNENGFTELIAGSYRNVEAYTQEYNKNLLNSKFNAWLKKKYGNDTNLRSAWRQNGKTGLKNDESLASGTVFFDYTYANNQDYSQGRKFDSNRFVYDTQKDMYNEMISFLRGMGVRCMITGTSLGLGAQNVATTALCDEVTDFVDIHSYNGHPTNWFNNGSKFNGFGSSTAWGVNMFWRLGHYRADKPYIIGEYQSCIPNPYGAETEPMMAVIASFQNWYPLNYDLRSDNKEYDALYCAFQTYNSPARTAVQPSSAIIYHRHDVREADKALEIPITRDNIINGVFEDWPKAGKIQFGVYTDYVKARYKIYENDAAFKAADKTVYNQVAKEVINRVNKKDTIVNDQIVWERDNTLMKVTTDYSNLVMGDLSGETYDSSAMKLQAQNPAATVTLVSLDDKLLKNSDHMLLTAVGRERNTDMVIDEETQDTMLDVGHAPILTEGVTADVVIKASSPIAVFALDSSGRKKEKVDVTSVAEGYSFKLLPRYETLYYEIEKIGNGVVYGESDIFVGEAIISGYAENGGASVSVMVKTPSGRTCNSFTVTSDSQGFFSRTFELGERMERGTYLVEAVFANGAKSTDTFAYERPSLAESDDADKTYVRYSDGITILDANGNLGGEAENKGNKTFAENTDDGYKISFNKAVKPFEFKVNCTNISPEFEETAFVEFEIDKGSATGTPVLSFRRVFDMIRLDISKYMDMTKSGFQTVRVPLGEFADCKEFDFSKSEYYIGIGFDRKTTADVVIRNMRLGIQLDETAEYYYKGEDIIPLIEDGAVIQGVTVYADRSTPGIAKVTRNVVEDSKNCIKVDFNGTKSAVIFGHPSTKHFVKVDADSDYILAMRVKVMGDTKNVSLEKTKASFTGGVETVSPVGMYFNGSTEWQTVYLPITADLSNVYGVGIATGDMDFFIESAYLIPRDSEVFSEIQQERAFVVEKEIFKNGQYGVSHTKYLENDGYPTTGAEGTNGQYGQKTIRMICLGVQGLTFSVDDLGITDENYADKYIAFDIYNKDSLVGQVKIGRTGGANHEWITVGYDPTKWQRILVPLGAFSKVSKLPWSETESVHIAMGDTTWWRTYELDNIVVGSFVDGVFEEKSALDAAGNAKFELSNSMNAAFEFVQQGENIFAVKKDGVFKGAVTVDPATAVVQGGSTAELTLWNATAQKGDTIEWYRWRSDESLAPVEEKLDVIIK